MLKQNQPGVKKANPQTYSKVFEILSGFSSKRICLVHEGSTIKLYSLSIFNRKTHPVLLLTATVGEDELKVESCRGKYAGAPHKYKLPPKESDRVVGEYLDMVRECAETSIKPEMQPLSSMPL